jgi:hypothetical protein
VLLQYPHVNDQMPFRYQVILDMLKDYGVAPAALDETIEIDLGALPFPPGANATYLKPDGTVLKQVRLDITGNRLRLPMIPECYKVQLKP